MPRSRTQHPDCTPSQLGPHSRPLKVAAASPATVSAAVPDMADGRQWAAILGWREKLISRSPNEFHMVKGVSFDGRQASVTLLSSGQAVVVAADVGNPYDCHAKAILTTDMRQLGYVPREAAQDFPLMVSFGEVVSSGRAKGTVLWGAKVELRPSCPGLWLDLLPDSWQQETDMNKILGCKEWQRVQQHVLKTYSNCCAISGTPADQLQQQLVVVPQWGFSSDHEVVYLAGLLPVCEPILQLKQQLGEAGEALLATPEMQEALQAEQDLRERLTPQLERLVKEENEEEAQVQAEAAVERAYQELEEVEHKMARASQALPADKQEALQRLGALMHWGQSDCLRYVLGAVERRQKLEEVDSNGEREWTMCTPDSEWVSDLLETRAEGVKG